MRETLLFCAGLILFLIAMAQLSAGVQKLFTARLRSAIRYAVRKPVYGVLTGIGATILLQSSSATTLLTIGMVNAGLIGFYHSLGIILGADIGTALTVQLVVWRITDASPVILMIGGAVRLFGSERTKAAGEAVFSFGLMFFGLGLMAQTTLPLKDSALFAGFLGAAANPFMGVVLGALFTGLVHASAVPVSLLIILAQQGLITLDLALPVVFGANLGTTVTALMASAIGGPAGRQQRPVPPALQGHGDDPVPGVLPVLHRPAPHGGGEHGTTDRLRTLLLQPAHRPGVHLRPAALRGPDETGDARCRPCPAAVAGIPR
jgi:phosphate:Na+ symporter